MAIMMCNPQNHWNFGTADLLNRLLKMEKFMQEDPVMIKDNFICM